MRYVIVGSGNISKTWLNAIAELNDSEVLGYVSRSGKNATTSLPVWKNLQEVDIEFDAVVVATPNGLHHQSILDAANLGKHIVTEKPLEISLERVDQCIEACKKAGVTLAVAFQRRTAPDNAAIKTLITNAAFGRIYAVDLWAKFYRTQSYYDSADYRGGFSIDGGGVFMQQASHNLDIYTWFFGLPVQVVSMLDTFAHNMEAEDHGAALLRHQNGMIGTVVASTAAKPGFAARMEVHTEKGSFTLIDDVISDWHIDGLPNPTDLQYEYKHDGATSAAVADSRGHKDILIDFENAVRTGNQPLAHAESARLATELILAIYQSKV